jgi:hypothetical protein
MAGQPRRTETTASSTSPLGPFDILNVKYRVVTPPRPRPLLSYLDEAGVPCNRIREIFGNEFELEALKIARDVGVPITSTCDDVTLTTRVFRDDPSDSQPAIYIVVDAWTEESASLWQKLVTHLKIYVDGRINDTERAGGIDMSVEVVHRELERLKYIALIVPSNPPNYSELEDAWPRVKAGVFEILQTSDTTADRMTSISLFRMGFDRYWNPMTVYVTVDYESQESGWPPVVNKMQSFLDGLGLHLQVHLEHGIIGHQSFPLLHFRQPQADRVDRRRDFFSYIDGPYSTTVNLGADIGASCYLPGEDGAPVSALVGTLGCWLEVYVKNKGWKKVALTNYHVVRPTVEGFTVSDVADSFGAVVQRGKITAPAKDSKLREADVHGLVPKNANERECMEHPTRAKHNFAVEMTQLELTSRSPGEGRAAQARELNDKIAFFDNGKQLLGRVWLASGYMRRSRTNGRLDWALLEPLQDSQRTGGNALPTREQWALNYKFPSRPHERTFGASLQPPAGSIRDRPTTDLVYKHGASTRWTVGIFSKIKTDCSMSEERYMEGRTTEQRKSTEHVFLGMRDNSNRTTFSNRGDSGAIVWDSNGRALGLLFTGQQPQQTTDGYSLVIPVEDVFDSIKEMTKGKITDVRIAGT